MNLCLKFAICALLGVRMAAAADSNDTLLVDALGPPEPIPDARQLEAQGARIGNVDIVVDEVFERGSKLAAPYRLANALHMGTREQTIRAQLLFQSGDRFEQRLLEETARALRDRHYLSDARIEPYAYHDGSVDVRVHVHDVWTLVPSFSLGRKGGSNTTKIEIEDTNLFGWGKELSLESSSDADRDSTRLQYRDPNLLGSRWQLAGAYRESSDGGERSFDLARPFYALDARWSAEVSGSQLRSITSRYSLGQAVDEFNTERRSFTLSGGVSSGLHEGWTRRLLAGINYDDRSFSAVPNGGIEAFPRPGGDVLPPARRLVYPWVGLELIEDQFQQTCNLEQIGRTEDLFLGRAARVEVGFAPEALGSTRNSLLLSGSLRAGAHWNDRRFMINTLSWHGRLEDGSLANGLLELSSRYYLRQSPRRVLFAGLNATVTDHLDPEEQLLLGGDNGLRGYPLRYQGGTSRALLTLEERFYTKWQPLKLFNVGAAVFVDAGRTWGHDDFASDSRGWLSNVGVGLRLGNARSGLGSVLHLDVAYPVGGPRDLDKLQFIIETRRSF